MSQYSYQSFILKPGFYADKLLTSGFCIVEQVLVLESLLATSNQPLYLWKDDATHPPLEKGGMNEAPSVYVEDRLGRTGFYFFRLLNKRMEQLLIVQRTIVVRCMEK